MQNSVKRTGSYALLTGAGTTGSGNAYRVQVFSTTPSTIYLRCAVYHTSAGSGAGGLR